MNLVKALSIFQVTELTELDLDILKTKYHAFAKQAHPDKKGGDSRAFVELKEAYHLLQDILRDVMVENYKTQKTQTNLSREEILANYYRDTNSLQFRLSLFHDEARHTLAETKEHFEEVWKEFQVERQKLQKELEISLDLLKKQNRNWVKKFMNLFASSDTSYDKLYQNKLTEYEQKYNELDIRYFKQVLEIYGSGLNRIHDVLDYDKDVNEEDADKQDKK